MGLAATLKEIESMPLGEQIELVQQVWDRILDSGWQPELTDEQKAELDQRLNDLDANPANVVSWDNIVRHVRRTR
jgi:putative addiction module component (TIGR02574 family)